MFEEKDNNLLRESKKKLQEFEKENNRLLSEWRQSENDYINMVKRIEMGKITKFQNDSESDNNQLLYLNKQSDNIQKKITKNEETLTKLQDNKTKNSEKLTKLNAKKDELDKIKYIFNIDPNGLFNELTDVQKNKMKTYNNTDQITDEYTESFNKFLEYEKEVILIILKKYGIDIVNFQNITTGITNKYCMAIGDYVNFITHNIVKYNKDYEKDFDKRGTDKEYERVEKEIETQKKYEEELNEKIKKLEEENTDNTTVLNKLTKNISDLKDEIKNTNFDGKKEAYAKIISDIIEEKKKHESKYYAKKKENDEKEYQKYNKQITENKQKLEKLKESGDFVNYKLLYDANKELLMKLYETKINNIKNNKFSIESSLKQAHDNNEKKLEQLTIEENKNTEISKKLTTLESNKYLLKGSTLENDQLDYEIEKTRKEKSRIDSNIARLTVEYAETNQILENTQNYYEELDNSENELIDEEKERINEEKNEENTKRKDFFNKNEDKIKEFKKLPNIDEKFLQIKDYKKGILNYNNLNDLLKDNIDDLTQYDIFSVIEKFKTVYGTELTKIRTKKNKGLSGGAINDIDNINGTIDDLLTDYYEKVIKRLLMIPELRIYTEKPLTAFLKDKINEINNIPDDNTVYVDYDGKYILFTEFKYTAIGKLNSCVVHCVEIVRILNEIYNKTIKELNSKFNEMIDLLNVYYGFIASKHVYNSTSVTQVPFISIPKMPDIVNNNLDNIILRYTDAVRYKNEIIKENYPKHVQNTRPKYIIIDNNPNNPIMPTIGYMGAIRNIDNEFNKDNNEYNISGKKFKYDELPGGVFTGYVGSIRDVDKPLENIAPILGEILDKHLFIIKSKIAELLIRKILPSTLPLVYGDEIKAFKDDIKDIVGTDPDNNYVKSTIIEIFNSIYLRGLTVLSKQSARNNINYVIGELPLIKGKFSISRDEFSNELEDIKKAVDESLKKIQKTLPTIDYITKHIDIYNKSQEIYDKYDGKQHEINSWDTQTRTCYDVNPDTLKYLIDNGADLNQRDNAGRTPIFYAIDLKHQEIIKLLLPYITTYSEKAVDYAGNTPCRYAFWKLQNYVKSQNIKSMFEKSNEKILEDIKQKFKYDKNLLYSDIIMKWVLYLVNQQLTDLEYFDKNKDTNSKIWLYSDRKKLFEYLNINDDHDLKFIKLKKQNTLSLNDEQKEKINVYIENCKTNIKSLDLSIKEISKELTIVSYNIDNKKSVDLANLKKIYEKEKKTLEETINELNKKLTDSNSNSIIQTNESFLDDLSGINYNTNSNIIDTYKSIYNKINNSTKYSERWDFLLKMDITGDNTQIPLLVLNNLSNCPTTQYIDSYDKCDIYCKYITSVLIPIINDYFQLPKKYKHHNYLLTSLVHIYEHVLRHTLCESYNLTLTEMTLRYLEKVYPGGVDNIGKLYKLFKCERDGREKTCKVTNYILDKMPNLLVRKILEVFSHDRDESAVTDVTSILKNASSLINENIEKDENGNKLITNINTYIIPYFETYFTQFIEEMHKNVETYFKLIQNIAIDAKILSIIYNHSIKEFNDTKLIQ
jgi:hypothetical protein